MGHDDVVFLMVAGIRPVKNLCPALTAFREIEDRIPSARLILVGPVLDQKEAEKVESIGKRLHSYAYLGEKSSREVRELMRASDVLLNTSLHEGMPGAILEAMAEGLPVLASAVPGNTSLIRDGENGMLFHPDNREELVGRALRLAGSARLRALLGQAGRDFVNREHSAQRELESYHALYTALLDEAGNGALSRNSCDCQASCNRHHS
jgi:glycosyltransferase involved in cell wall biosynthesis